jgi:hypothetical protein
VSPKHVVEDQSGMGLRFTGLGLRLVILGSSIIDFKRFEQRVRWLIRCLSSVTGYSTVILWLKADDTRCLIVTAITMHSHYNMKSMDRSIDSATCFALGVSHGATCNRSLVLLGSARLLFRTLHNRGQFPLTFLIFCSSAYLLLSRVR